MSKLGHGGGPTAKDASLQEGFNKKPKYVAKLDPVTKKFMPQGRNNPQYLRRKARKEEKRREAAGLPPVPPVPVEDVDDDLDDLSRGELKSAFKMLEDMRNIYQHGGNGHKSGRARLRKLMDSDKEFMTMVRELMKIETALLSARIRKEGAGPGEGGGGGFLVILKGLDTDKELLAAAGAEDKTVDLKQVRHVLDPSAGVYEPEEQEKEEALPETPQEG